MYTGVDLVVAMLIIFILTFIIILGNIEEDKGCGKNCKCKKD